MSEGQLKEKKGLMDLTIAEMEELEIKMSDIFSKDGTRLNFTWQQVIKTVNYLA